MSLSKHGFHMHFFHQNARAIQNQFSLSRPQAKGIIATCPEYQKDSLSSTASGVNPRGLASSELWLSDVTHFAAFGTLKYVHVSVDTFSGAVFASCHTVGSQASGWHSPLTDQTGHCGAYAWHTKASLTTTKRGEMEGINLHLTKG